MHDGSATMAPDQGNTHHDVFNAESIFSEPLMPEGSGGVDVNRWQA